MLKAGKPTETFSGGFAGLPHAVLDSAAFQGASHRAKAMMLELVRQHAGRNNGRLQLSIKWLRKRGWGSTDQIQKAKAEIMERGLVERTKLGGLGTGPDWFAVTWLPISDYRGLDIQQGTFRQGQWSLMNTPPPVGRRVARSATRNSVVPSHGTGSSSPVPQHGTLTADFAPSPVPPHGNNVVASSRSGKVARVVGRSGRSGVRNTHASVELVVDRDRFILKPAHGPKIANVTGPSTVEGGAVQFEDAKETKR